MVCLQYLRDGLYQGRVMKEPNSTAYEGMKLEREADRNLPEPILRRPFQPH